jgi:hypothetical protein
VFLEAFKFRQETSTVAHARSMLLWSIYDKLEKQDESPGSSPHA